MADELLRCIPYDVIAHSRRVAMYCTSVVIHEYERYSDIGIAGAEHIFKTFLYHDVGKTFVPLQILTKPGKLDDNEWTAVQRHPEFGELYLMDRISYNWQLHHVMNLASTISLQHHERWDGSGYPYGIGGTCIHPMSRVCAICDSFDAMTVDRCYQRARTFDKAVEEINNCAGTQFDPEAVDAFMTAIDSVKQLWTDYRS